MVSITNYRVRAPGQPVPVLFEAPVVPQPSPPRPPVVRRLDPADTDPTPIPPPPPAPVVNLVGPILPGPRRIWTIPATAEEKYAAGMNARALLRVVAQVTGVTVSELRGPCRLRKIARPRQLWMLLTELHCPALALPRVAAIIDRDHTTIMHGRSEIMRLLPLPENDVLRDWFAQCQQIIERAKSVTE